MTVTSTCVTEEKVSPKLSSEIFTTSNLERFNQKLENLDATTILQWSIVTAPSLFQTTAFGLTGLVTLDMVSRLYPSNHPVDLIFVDTLYHFQETLDLVDRIKSRYPNVRLHVYKPVDCETPEDFEAKYGEKLWETNEDLYDYLVKVEPINRAYEELGVKAALTGRRKSQGGQRGSIPIVEQTESGLIKINPLANWNFKDVKEYVEKYNVPYNSLLDKGYRSVGDWHSTEPVKEGEDERAGRWKGKQKTECGIHENSRFAQYLSSVKMQSA